MPTIDTIPLNNPTFGWKHRATSEPLPSYENDLSDLKRAGRDGVVSIPGTTSPVMLRIVVQTPRSGLEALIALFKQGTVWADGGREAAMEFRSVSPTGFGAADQLVDATFVIRLPGAFMRATAPETTALTITAASHTLSCFAAHPVGQVGQWRNLLTNPSFETSGAPVVVRTNWCLNPSFEVNTASWTAVNGAAPTRTTAQAHRGTASMQVVTPGAVGGEGAYATPSTVPGMAVGNAWCASVWVLAPAGATMQAVANTVGTGGTSPVVNFTGTGAWQFITLPGAIAASTAPYVIVRTVAVQALTFYVDEVLIEVGVSTPGAYFDGMTQPILRTNYVGDPSATAGTGWALFTNSTQTAGTDSPPEGGSSRLITTTAANGGVTWNVQNAAGTNPSPAGTTYAYMSVKMNAGDLGSWYIAEYEGLTLIGRSAAATGITGTGDWMRVGGPWTKASPTSRVRLEVFKSTPGSYQVGAGYLSDSNGPHFAGTIAPQGFASAFSGTTTASPTILWDADFSTRWQNTANASASELTGTRVAGIKAEIGVLGVQSGRGAVAGTKGVRLIATGASTDSFLSIDLPAAARGVPVTAVATSYMETGAPAGTGNVPRLRTVLPDANGNLRTPGLLGPQEHRLTATPSSAPFELRLMHGGTAGSPDVWWDLAALVPGVFTGRAFTGVTAPPDRLSTIVWDGLPDQSTSTWTQYASWDGGLSAPIQDAVLRLKGPATGIQVTDSSGAWVILPDTPAGTWSRFEADTGQCFQTTTDVWSGGTEVSGLVDFGGPRGVFEITPVMSPGDPGSRGGQLTVTTATRPGAPVFEVRGKPAYLL